MASSLDEAVSTVAVLMDEPERAKARAEVVAGQLGPSAIPELSRRFHSPPHPEPPGWGSRERGFGAWMSAWQFAIFELFIRFGTAALPVVRDTAFGDYDWTQSYAVEALVRLAASGVEREAILTDLRREFGRLPLEVKLYVVEILHHHRQHDLATSELLAELETIPEWREAVAWWVEDQQEGEEE